MPQLWSWQMVKPWCKVLRCYTELVEECGRCYTTLCQGCYVVCIHGVCPLASLWMSVVPAHGYCLDTYYWTCSLSFWYVLVPKILISSWHSFTICSSKTLVNLPIHVSLCILHTFIVLLIVSTYSFISCFSAFLLMLKLVVLSMLFNFNFIEVLSLLKHLTVNFLWFSESAIFLISFSHFGSSTTCSLPYSFSISKCRFLILICSI